MSAVSIDHLHLSQIKNNGVSNGVPHVPAATANGTYSDGSIKNITASATWASSNTSVATIDYSGSAASTESIYTNTSAASGTWNVNATALN